MEITIKNNNKKLEKIFLFKTSDKDEKITNNNTQQREDLRY